MAAEMAGPPAPPRRRPAAPALRALLLRLAPALLGAAALLARPAGFAAAAAPAAAEDWQKRLASSIVECIDVVIQLLPGVLAALIGYALWTVFGARPSPPRKPLAATAGLCLLALLAAARLQLGGGLGLRTRGAAPATGPRILNRAPAGGAAAAGAGPPALAPAGPALSGELVCAAGGVCSLQQDPRQPTGAPPAADWTRGLSEAMTGAMRSGREQVVIVFSQQNCRWCEKLRPVLERAIVQRSKVASGADAAGSLLGSPLRVFVLDGEQFGAIGEQFGVKSFPAIMFFGPPEQEPVTHEGYLDDTKFEEYLQVVAGPDGPGLPFHY